MQYARYCKYAAGQHAEQAPGEGPGGLIRSGALSDA